MIDFIKNIALMACVAWCGYQAWEKYGGSVPVDAPQLIAVDWADLADVEQFESRGQMLAAARVIHQQLDKLSQAGFMILDQKAVYRAPAHLLIDSRVAKRLLGDNWDESEFAEAE